MLIPLNQNLDPATAHMHETYTMCELLCGRGCVGITSLCNNIVWVCFFFFFFFFHSFSCILVTFTTFFCVLSKVPPKVMAEKPHPSPQGSGFLPAHTISCAFFTRSRAYLALSPD